MYRVNGPLMLLLLSAMACGGAQINQAKVTDAESSVRAAEAVGANEQPQAALHLQLAKDEIAEAQRLAKDGDGDGATLMLDRARADAELSMQLARTEQEQQKARQAWQKIQEMKQEQR